MRFQSQMIAAGLIVGLAAPPSRAAVYDVNILGDPAGAVCPGSRCSLRAAIEAANTSPGLDEITFSVSGALPVLDELPDITNVVTINGTTAPGYIDAGPPKVAIVTR